MKNKIMPGLLDWSPAKAKGFFSKKLLNVESGTIRLIKVEPGASYPVHMHPDKIEYAYVLVGNPTFTINDTDYEGQVGEFFILTPGIRHGIKNNALNECMMLFGTLNAGQNSESGK